MRPVTMRFTDAQKQFIEHAAKQQGVTVAQFVREAAMARAWMEVALERGELSRNLRAVYEAVHEAEPPPRRPSPRND